MNQLDVSLEDEELLNEVEPSTSHVIAASQCAHDYLPQEQIDATLEVARHHRCMFPRHDATWQATIPTPRPSPPK